jgi:hypothetical protein
VNGIAGTGKTHFMKTLVARLRTDGKRVDCISKTHTASERMGGVTADHYVRRHILHGSCSCHVLWIDEISQLDCSLWAQLNKLDVQFLLSGDFNQFPALFDSWRGSPVEEGAFQRSALLHRLAGGNRLTLTTCRRSDSELFEYYSSLIQGGTRFNLPLSQVLQEARERFHYDGPARHNLCISHRKRMALNRQLNTRREGAIFLKAPAARGNAAQSMWLYPGIELLGSGRGIRNNVMYTVEAVTADSVTVGGTTLTHAQTLAFLRLSFARTYASIQGTEFNESLRLHDTDNAHFTHRHLFVAISRACAGTLISVT